MLIISAPNVSTTGTGSKSLSIANAVKAGLENLGAGNVRVTDLRDFDLRFCVMCQGCAVAHCVAPVSLNPDRDPRPGCGRDGGKDQPLFSDRFLDTAAGDRWRSRVEIVITSYSIHYTKLYDPTSI